VPSHCPPGAVSKRGDEHKSVRSSALGADGISFLDTVPARSKPGTGQTAALLRTAALLWSLDPARDHLVGVFRPGETVPMAPSVHRRVMSKSCHCRLPTQLQLGLGGGRGTSPRSPAAPQVRHARAASHPVSPAADRALARSWHPPRPASGLSIAWLRRGHRSSRSTTARTHRGPCGGPRSWRSAREPYQGGAAGVSAVASSGLARERAGAARGRASRRAVLSFCSAIGTNTIR